MMRRVKERRRVSQSMYLLTTLQFLRIMEKGPKNIYQLGHYENGTLETPPFDTHKLYRYLHGSLDLGLVKFDHVAEKGFLPPKFYVLTEKGRRLLEIFYPKQGPQAHEL